METAEARFLERIKYLDDQVTLAILGIDLTTSQDINIGTYSQDIVKLNRNNK